MRDLANKFDAMDDKVELGDTRVTSLFWAADLILIAESKEGLNHLPKTLEEYCQENH